MALRLNFARPRLFRPIGIYLVASATVSVASCANDTEPTYYAGAGQPQLVPSAGSPSGGRAGAPSGLGGGNVPSFAGAPLAGASNAGASFGGTSGSGAGAGTSGTTGGGQTCAPPAAAQPCSGTIPKKDLLLGFGTYKADGQWGLDSSGDLTGGTHRFQGAGAEPLTLAIEGIGDTATLHVTGPIPAGGYAGFVFWIGPCVNAASITNEAQIPPGEPIVTSPTTGISFPIGGSLGGTRMKLQVQTHLDYPADASAAKGGCVFTSCDTRWTECASPSRTIDLVTADVIGTSFLWSSFSEGKPVPTTTGDGVVGIQFQFECITQEPCSVNLRLGSISFSK